MNVEDFTSNDLLPPQ